MIIATVEDDEGGGGDGVGGVGDGGVPSHLSLRRRRAFMKKLPTVFGCRPSCRAIDTCISLDGRFVS